MPSNLTESQLWESNGSSFTFSNVSAAQGVNDTGRSRTGIYGDYDQDGDPDLLLVNYAGDVRLFRNDNGGSNNYLILDLQGVTSNFDGIGARIALTSAGGTQFYETRSGSSLGGGDDTGAYFGLGSDATVTSITITWPSGTVQTLDNVGVNQRLLVVEGSTTGGGGLFTDVTASAGVNVTHSGNSTGDMGIGTGAAWFDYDNDGDQDLYMTNRESANHLFQNNGGFFTDVAAAAGVADASVETVQVLQLLTTTMTAASTCTWRTRSAMYSLRTIAMVHLPTYLLAQDLDITEDRRGTSASWGDFNGDGFVDLYVANHMPVDGAVFTGDAEQDYLFQNDGDGTFTDVSDAMLGTDRIGRSFIAGWTDYDNDGDVDLYTIRDCPFGQNSGPMRLYRNDGGTAFTQVAESLGADWCQNGMGLAVGDYNRDGWMDFFFTDNGAGTDEYPDSPHQKRCSSPSQ